MKISKTIIAAALLLFAGVAQAKAVTINANKPHTTRTMPNITAFDAINVTSIIDVEYSQKPGPSTVMIYAPDNVFDYFDIRSTGGTLNVGLKKDVRITGDHDIKVIVTSESIKNVTLSGTGDIDMKGMIKASNFMIAINGTGDAEIDNMSCTMFQTTIKGTGDLDIERLACDKVSVALSGTGDAELGGSAIEANYNTNGTGDIEAGGLSAKNVTATAVGTGDITCRATESLTATASGTGRIYYFGMPKQVNRNGRAKYILGR